MLVEFKNIVPGTKGKMPDGTDVVVIDRGFCRLIVKASDGRIFEMWDDDAVWER